MGRQHEPGDGDRSYVSIESKAVQSVHRIKRLPGPNTNPPNSRNASGSPTASVARAGEDRQMRMRWSDRSHPSPTPRIESLPAPVGPCGRRSRLPTRRRCHPTRRFPAERASFRPAVPLVSIAGRATVAQERARTRRPVPAFGLHVESGAAAVPLPRCSLRPQEVYSGARSGS